MLRFYIIWHISIYIIKFVIKSSIKMLEPGLPAFSYIASVVFWNLVVFSNFLGIIYILRNRPTRAQTTSWSRPLRKGLWSEKHCMLEDKRGVWKTTKWLVIKRFLFDLRQTMVFNERFIKDISCRKDYRAKSEREKPTIPVQVLRYLAVNSVRKHKFVNKKLKWFQFDPSPLYY